jgi:NAD(P)-dependent dehydrogenase (short-subunit alcohol dehydrogenase family)
MKTAFISGVSSGLGRGFAQALHRKNHTVYGVSRRRPDLPFVRHVSCDLTDFDSVPARMNELLGDVRHPDLVIMNAGKLSQIQDMRDTPLEELRSVFDINVWAQKNLLDWFLNTGRFPAQIILISSGAAVVGNRGWGSYALSKAALNMLGQLYAHEFPEKTHISALAPGLIDTPMTRYLRTEADNTKFTALNRIIAAKEDGTMLPPQKAAERVIAVLDELKKQPRGSFTDIRKLDSPEEYEELMRMKKDHP